MLEKVFPPCSSFVHHSGCLSFFLVAINFLKIKFIACFWHKSCVRMSCDHCMARWERHVSISFSYYFKFVSDEHEMFRFCCFIYGEKKGKKITKIFHFETSSLWNVLTWSWTACDTSLVLNKFLYQKSTHIRWMGKTVTTFIFERSIHIVYIHNNDGVAISPQA